MGHVHAELMAQYAEDARETSRPWERWQHSAPGKWRDCAGHPQFDEEVQYRRKPRTITINGREVPEPMREAAKRGKGYFIAVPTRNDLYSEETWRGDEMDICWLSRGLCHSTKEAALAHAEALLSFTECK